VDLLQKEIPNHSFLADCFNREALLAPMPRSAPLSEGQALWPTNKLCRLIVEAGLAGDSAPLLERFRAVPKSAFCAPGERPKPSAHFESLRVQDQLGTHRRLVVVDDVITKGSTFVGAYRRLRESFPEIPIQCFAVVRTMQQEVTEVVAPIVGKIVHSGDWFKRLD
jgi:hypothetical protein